jgi:hypothetical protein
MIPDIWILETKPPDQGAHPSHIFGHALFSSIHMNLFHDIQEDGYGHKQLLDIANIYYLWQ